ncbi:exonuclease SbcCD subunit D [Arthrobacter sp. zg-Y844]|uniref:metallophosphoesterase family protein n=1 Tax=Arthrobacter sp. zg-Y844 TaxID=2964612 RepID=UPI002105E836|nr:exonuclease SbcCD subunit D [Arthrobacter sp. zg-Y844]MCQ1985208.1 exonuclease SbcCD subunit D [Arthrobacter sp. zg-Y844]
MRLLHTSDWHLGRSFHGVGMLDAQADFIDRLVDTVREQRVDAVLIAGDVYDRALPAVDTVRLLDSALERITGAGAVVVLSSGNHDSAARLGFGSALFERAGVHLRTRYEDIARPVLLPAEGRPVAVYGIPYLEPRLAAGELGVEVPNHFSVTEAAVRRIRADILAREQAGAPVASVVMAHTFASGGISSDSERDLAVGGLGAVPLDLFDEFSYTALGHLHGRQQLSPAVRYSGSPLPYSFSEARQAKGGWLLEFDGDGLASVEAVTWPARRRLAVLRGKLDDLLADPDLAEAQDAYCQVTLTDSQRPAKAMELLRTRFPDTLVLAFDPEGGARGPDQTYSQRLAKATDDLDICCGFLEHVRSRSAADEEKDLFIEILGKVREAEAAQ